MIRSSLPRTVWALGFVSLLMDTSSELVHSLLPLYLADGLGASVLAIGVIEGVAESLTPAVKVFSGYASDVMRRRKPLVLAGYALAALTRLIFPLAASLPWVVAARFLDRVGKGIRGAPRDALVADVTPPAVRGAAFGLRQALDTVGAVAGPLLAVAAIGATAGDFRAAFWIAVLPAFLSVLLIAVGVREPASRASSAATPAAPVRPRVRVRWRDARRLGRAFAFVTAIGAVLTLARFSEAFLVLRGRDVGLSPEQAPWMMVAMSLVYAVAAYPAGRAADRGGAQRLLLAGMLALAASDVTLAFARAPLAALLGAALWGLHIALTQGLLAALVAATAPAELRGSAFGVFNLASGAALLLASVVAGALWQAVAPAAAFAAGALFTALALAGWLAVRRQLPPLAAEGA